MKLNADTTEAEEKEKDGAMFMGVWFWQLFTPHCLLPFQLDKISTKLTFRISVQRLLPRDAVSGDHASVDLWIFGSANSGRKNWPTRKSGAPALVPSDGSAMLRLDICPLDWYKLRIQTTIHVSTYDILIYIHIIILMCMYNRKESEIRDPNLRASCWLFKLFQAALRLKEKLLWTTPLRHGTQWDRNGVSKVAWKKQDKQEEPSQKDNEKQPNERSSLWMQTHRWPRQRAAMTGSNVSRDASWLLGVN